MKICDKCARKQKTREAIPLASWEIVSMGEYELASQPSLEMDLCHKHHQELAELIKEWLEDER